MIGQLQLYGLALTEGQTDRKLFLAVSRSNRSILKTIPIPSLKIDREFGRLPRPTFERKLEPVLIQNLLRQRQSDPLPVVFSAEKRCEQIGAHRRRNATSR